ncbi:ArsA family ATPase [Citricoccus nitrophenolicus]|uniref:ArsA family ATPase n=1 Tax=Citricoccus nitrophenolicus TaxID=863575 RepID=UPI0031E7A05C
MLLNHLADRRILFFGGKGGVGKTTLASATASALARTGKTVLLVSTDPAHNLGHLWDRQVGSGLVHLAPGITGTEVDPGATAAAHLSAVSATVRGMMPEHLHREVERYFDLARSSPGTHEAAMLERISEIATTGLESHDVIIFDTAPTGHTTRLLDLPRLMTAWTEGLLSRRTKTERFADALKGLEPRSRGDGLGGPQGEDRTGEARAGGRGSSPRSAQESRDARIRSILEARQALFHRMHGLLTDADLTAFVVVLTAERLPVLESVALHGELTQTGLDVAALAVNRRSPTDQGEFLAQRHAAEADHLASLQSQLPEVPVEEFPLLGGEMTGPAAVQRFAELLR